MEGSVLKIVIASDSYKESLRAIEVCKAIEKGFTKIFPEAEYVKVPIGDGGEGTVQSSPLLMLQEERLFHFM